MLVFLPATANGFVWDDWISLFRVEYSLPRFWVSELTSPLPFSRNYYRPVPVASFIAEIYLHGGPDPYAMHLTNVLLHGLNTTLVAILAFQLGRHYQAPITHVRIASIAAGLVYGCHPALVEAAAWVSGRFDLLLTTFLLLALLANTLTTDRILRPVLVGLAFFTAALCKETAVAFPFVLIAWNLAWDPRSLWPLRTLFADMHRRGELVVYLAVILAGVLYLLLRNGSLGHLLKMQYLSGEAFSALTLQKILFSAETLGRYLYTILNPYSSISVTHPHDYPALLDDMEAWASLAASIAVIAALVLLIRRNPRIGWLWAAMLVSLGPLLHIFPIAIGDNITHDRFLTYPLTFFSLALTPLLITLLRVDTHQDPQLRTLKRGTIALATSLIAFSIVNVRVTIPLWRNDATLWSWAVVRTPDSFLAQVNMSNAYIVARDFTKAIEHATKTIEIAPTHYAGYSMVGKALLIDNKPREALGFLRKASEMTQASPDGNYSGILTNLAHAYLQLGQYEDAEPVLIQAGALAPLNRTINQLLYILYARTGRQTEGELAFERSTLGYTQEKKSADLESLNHLLAGKIYPKTAVRQATSRIEKS